MWQFSLVLLCLVIVRAQHIPKSVCYDLVGCFSMEPPWCTIWRFLPEPRGPSDTGTTLFFYRRPRIEKANRVDVYPSLSFNYKLKASKPIVFIVHGFLCDGNTPWVIDLKNAYLKHKDANVFVVDWGDGASIWNYLQVASNARVVGRQLSNFIWHLITNFPVNLDDIHLIGHSVGAHICAYAAKEIAGIGRLTALDPAQPAFEGYHPMVRLDRDDAKFVDVVHTHAIPFIPGFGFGMLAAHGDVDFYMNGGKLQPGCFPRSRVPKLRELIQLAKMPLKFVMSIVVCHHNRAHQYFVEAIEKSGACLFWGRKLGDYVQNNSCTLENCAPLGFDTHTSKMRGIVFMDTNSSPPFCKG